MPVSRRLPLLLLLLVLAGTSTRPAVAMPDQVVRAPAPVARPAPPAPGGRSDPPAPARGVWPLAPRPEVVRPFDPPASTYAAGHRGADLRGRVGQGVRAALAGEVVFAARLAGRGVVVVSHGATRTTYEPVRASVHRGDHVDAGEVLGSLEWSGSHCLPVACLHWGLRRGETYLDPLLLVGAGPQPVRLLPW